MAVTLPTADDVVNYRVGPAEDWTGNTAAIEPALRAAIYWASIRVSPSSIEEADMITNPDSAVSPNIGDMWRMAVILQTWAYLFTGLLPVTGVRAHEIDIRYQNGIFGNAVAEQYQKQAYDTIQLCTGVNLVLSGFPEINTNTQSMIDASADLTALSVRRW